LNKTKNIKPWTNSFKAFFILIVLFFISARVETQNVLEKTILANEIKSISINGNQIFNITVETSETDFIIIKSTLDGEYQNQFQIVTEEVDNQLKLSLEQIAFTTIEDDKRNAHKVIAATLQLVIPEQCSLNVISDVGSVDLSGEFNELTIELLQGYCTVLGTANSTIINTIDGDINVVTNSASINANSNNGIIDLDEFSISNSIWKLKSINGDITVAKQE